MPDDNSIGNSNILKYLRLIVTVMCGPDIDFAGSFNTGIFRMRGWNYFLQWRQKRKQLYSWTGEYL